MKEKDMKLCCPKVVPANEPSDFYIPESCCPERIQECKFPSPNTCMNEEDFEELESKINIANDLLLSLALNENNEELKNRGLRKSFDGLLDQNVCIHLNCAAETAINDESRTDDDSLDQINGKVFLSGIDFVLIRSGHLKVTVRYSDISKIKINHHFTTPDSSQELIAINPVLRRCITFRYGEIVSTSPELINILIGITLPVYLLQFINKRMLIVTKQTIYKGKLLEVTKEEIEILSDNDKNVLGLTDICYIAFT